MTKDLKTSRQREAFSDEELEELVAAEDLVDACDTPKKSVQDIYETLTPEQRAVVDYLIGDAVEQNEQELLKQRLQVQQHYILQGADPGQIQCYVDGKPLLSFPQPTIRPWDIRPW